MTDRKCRLGEVIELKYGKGLPERDRIDGRVPVYGSSGLVGYHSSALVTGPGIVVGRKGNVGAVHWVGHDFFPIDTTFYAVCRSPELDPRFAYYLLTSLPLTRMNSDAAVPGLNRENAYALPVFVPTLERQRRIVDLLRPYDDLISNNEERLSLLRQSAMLLYREWFVRHRYPGHEHARPSETVPPGWEHCDLGSAIELKYGKALKAEDRSEGPYTVYGSSGAVGTHTAALTEGPAIVVGRKGNVGSVYWVCNDFWPIDTVYYINKEQSDYWLYLTLPSLGFQNTDAGVPGLNRDFAYSRKLTLPPSRLRRVFNENVEPLFKQIAVLEGFSRKLKQARDLLLPRLMSGGIVV